MSNNKQHSIDLFKQHFYDKTLNHWEDRNNFKAQKDHYTYLIMDHSLKAIYCDFRVITFELNDKDINGNKMEITWSVQEN